MSKAKASMSEATPTRRAGFPDDFKQDAVRLIVDEKYSFKAAAEAVGVGVLAGSWRKKRVKNLLAPRLYGVLILTWRSRTHFAA